MVRVVLRCRACRCRCMPLSSFERAFGLERACQCGGSVCGGGCDGMSLYAADAGQACCCERYCSGANVLCYVMLCQKS